jgi:hypothetical protein
VLRWVLKGWRMAGLLLLEEKRLWGGATLLLLGGERL